METTVTNTEDEVTTNKPVSHTTDRTNANTTPGNTQLVSETASTTPAREIPAISEYPKEPSAAESAGDDQGNIGTATDVSHVTTQLFPTASLYSPHDENGAVSRETDKLLCAVMILFVTFLV